MEVLTVTSVAVGTRSHLRYKKEIGELKDSQKVT